MHWNVNDRCRSATSSGRLFRRGKWANSNFYWFWFLFFSVARVEMKMRWSNWRYRTGIACVCVCGFSPVAPMTLCLEDWDLTDCNVQCFSTSLDIRDRILTELFHSKWVNLFTVVFSFVNYTANYWNILTQHSLLMHSICRIVASAVLHQSNCFSLVLWTIPWNLRKVFFWWSDECSLLIRRMLHLHVMCFFVFQISSKAICRSHDRVVHSIHLDTTTSNAILWQLCENAYPCCMECRTTHAVWFLLRNRSDAPIGVDRFSIKQ